MLEKSESFFNRSKRVSPGGVHSPVRAFKGVGGIPPFIASAKGARMIDVDENEYLDFCMSWGPLILGHRDEDVEAAVHSAIEKGWSYGAAEPLSLELAELITNKIPWAEKIRFVNSGTEATLSVVRVARAATERDKILKFNGCYHGHLDALLVKAGSGLAEMASPDSAGVSQGIAKDTIVVPLNDEAAFDEAIERFGSELAAVLIEPLPANFGLLPQRREFLEHIAKKTRECGALLVFDEVISGFRVAFGGMAEKTGIRPDLVAYGKVIGGGFPVGAYAGQAELMSLVAPEGPVYQAGTLSANPVAMTAGLATLKKLLKENPYDRLDSLSEKLEKELPIPIQRSGSLFWIVRSEEETIRRPDHIPTRHTESFPKFFHALLEKGIYLAPSAFEVGFLSTAHTEKDIDRLVELVREVI